MGIIKMMEILIGSDYSRKVIELFENAKGQIDVMMYHWPPPRFAGKSRVHAVDSAIVVAASRGVKIRVILHCGFPSDPLFDINHRMSAWLRDRGVQVKFWKKSQTMHVKSVLVDRTFLISGSHNLSERAMSKNIETSFLVVGSGKIRKIQDYFNLLWRQI